MSIDFSKKIKDCALVNQYYIEMRYPKDTPLVFSNQEADECIKTAQKM